jgi:hypothetical protein
MKRNLKVSTRKAKQQYLLQGFTRCARCGYAFVGGGATGPIVDGQRTKSYYLCRSYVLQPVLREELCCRSPYVFCDFIDEHVWRFICEVITDPQLLISELEVQAEERVEEHASDRLAYVERNISKCEREEHQWDRAFASDILDLEEYAEKKAAVRTRMDALLEQRQEILREISGVQGLEVKKDIIRSHLEDIRRSGFAIDIPFQQKRRIMAMLIDRVVIDSVEKWYRLEGVLTGTQPFPHDDSFTCISAL